MQCNGCNWIFGLQWHLWAPTATLSTSETLSGLPHWAVTLHSTATLAFIIRTIHSHSNISIFHSRKSNLSWKPRALLFLSWSSQVSNSLDLGVCQLISDWDFLPLHVLLAKTKKGHPLQQMDVQHLPKTQRWFRLIIPTLKLLKTLIIFEKSSSKVYGHQ